VESTEDIRFHKDLRVGKRVIDMGFGSGVDDGIDLSELGDDRWIEGGAKVVEQELDVLVGSPACQPVK
jgi:hypothetical protein